MRAMRLLREPLVQFLALGGALFVAWVYVAPPGQEPPARIVVDGAVLQSLEQGFAAVWKRPPSASERAGLIADYIAEEVLYREAQKLGLDQDDTVIRRRMRQKMEFLLQDSLALTRPDEATLKAFFEAERLRYRAPDRLTFRQVYLGEAAAAEDRADWSTLRVRLNGDEPLAPERLGEATLLPARMEAATPQEIDRVFGRGFAERLRDQPEGRWTEPLRSSYGWHLVALDELEPGAPVTFEQVRAEVERDYAYQREREAAAALIERLKQGYEIVIDEEAR